MNIVLVKFTRGPDGIEYPFFPENASKGKKVEAAKRVSRNKNKIIYNTDTNECLMYVDDEITVELTDTGKASIVTEQEADAWLSANNSELNEKGIEFDQGALLYAIALLLTRRGVVPNEVEDILDLESDTPGACKRADTVRSLFGRAR